MSTSSPTNKGARLGHVLLNQSPAQVVEALLLFLLRLVALPKVYLYVQDTSTTITTQLMVEGYHGQSPFPSSHHTEQPQLLASSTYLRSRLRCAPSQPRMSLHEKIVSSGIVDHFPPRLHDGFFDLLASNQEQLLGISEILDHVRDGSGDMSSLEAIRMNLWQDIDRKKADSSSADDSDFIRWNNRQLKNWLNVNEVDDISVFVEQERFRKYAPNSILSVFSVSAFATEFTKRRPGILSILGCNWISCFEV